MSAMEALLSFLSLFLYLRGRALLVKHRHQRTGRWDEVGMGGRMSFDSHVRELWEAGLNISELHMPADSVTPQQLDPLGCLHTVYWKPELFYRWLEAEWTVGCGLCGVLPQHRMAE